MKEKLPGYHAISAEISFRANRARLNTRVFLKILRVMQDMAKECNRRGFVTTSYVRAAADMRKSMNRYLNEIVEDMRLAEEAYSRFMCLPLDADNERQQGFEAMVRAPVPRSLVDSERHSGPLRQ